MKRFILINIIALVSIFDATAQTATITFQSDEDISVKIFKPIDSAYNSTVKSDVLNLKKDVSVDYQTAVFEFYFLRCEYLDESKCDILLLPNDHLEIAYIKNKLVFKGSNAEGQTYINTRNFLVYYHNLIDSVFNHSISNKIDFGGIDINLKSKLLSPYYAELQKMSSANKISKPFEAIVCNDMEYVQFSMLNVEYKNLLGGRVHKYKPTTSDSIEIIKRINDQFNDPNLINEKTLKYNYAFVEDYFLFKWNTLSKENRALLRKNYPSETFGGITYYLAAPAYMQSVLFGKGFVDDLKYPNSSFDHSKLLTYLKEKYPNSEYIPIIQKKMKEQ
jgi:hypothetical protein